MVLNQVVNYCDKNMYNLKKNIISSDQLKKAEGSPNGLKALYSSKIDIFIQNWSG